MPRMICCDEVFDILTRGPFPSGEEHDLDVELHLRGCHDCRELAEALRPAVGLFHEALQEPDLPAYCGALPDSAAPPAAFRGHGVSVALLQFVRIAAAVLLITSACLAVCAVAPALRSRSAAPAPLAGRSAPLQAGAPLLPAKATLLSSLRLPSECLEPQQLQVASAVSQCCTGCHNAALKTPAPTDLSRLVRSCRACHDES